MKKIDYASLFTLRPDGRYQGYWHELIDGDPAGVRHTICDRDPKRLYERIQAKEKPSSPTFESVAEEWWVDHAEKLSRGTQATYRSRFNKLIELLGERKMDSIGAVDINRILIEQKTLRKSHRYCADMRSMLNQIFNYAVVKRVVSINPVSFVSVPRGMKHGHVEAPEESVIETIKANLDKPFGDFVAVLLYTGMRTEEAAALTWRDVGDAEISIHSAVDFHGTPIIKEAKTAAGNRTVPIFPQLKPYLARPKNAKDEDYVFNIKGKLLTRSQVSNRWLNWCKSAGLAIQKEYVNRRRGTRENCVRHEWRPLISPHQLRHNFATICFEAKLDPLTTKTIMGHSDISTTQKIYTSLRKKYKQEELTKLEKIL